MTEELHKLYDALPSCCQAIRLDQRDDGRLRASADFVFPAGYAGFAGHFPGRPILPAIVQLAAVRYLGEWAVGRTLAPSRVHKTKFKAVIGPQERITVAVDLAAGNGGWQGRFRLTRADGAAAADGSIEFISEGI